MKKTDLKELFSSPDSFAGKEVTVCGWIRTIRDSKSIGFIELADGSCFKKLQVVIEENNLDNFKELVKLNVGSAIIVTGNTVLTPNAQQPLEIHAVNVVVEGESASDYPLQKKRHSLEFLRSIAYFRPRTNTFDAVFRVRSVAAFAVHKFFNENGFVYAQTPLITGSDAEGAGEMFRVTTLDAKNPPLTKDGEVDFTEDFFGKAASLTVSGQLEAETMALAFGKAYTFGPTFRAENSNTTRHAAEFWMIEPEMAFADIEDIMQLGQDLMQYVLKYVMATCPDEIKFFNDFFDKELISRLENVADSDFARITYTEAIKLLEESGAEFKYPVSWGCDLQTEHERYITEKIFKKPVFVTDYPKEIKAFYMRVNEDDKTVAAMDLLVPGVGEIIGGSQREERYDVLVSKIEAMGLDVENYGWYLKLRKYGGTRHAGFGLGFERLIMYLTSMANIRDVVIAPRTVGNLDF